MEQQQQTKEWFLARRGKITASRLNDLMGVKGLGKMGESYINEILADYWTEIDEDSFLNSDIQRGVDFEAAAIKRYEYEQLTPVIPCGFIAYNEFFGGSPDGLIGENGLIEVKCKNHKNHAAILRSREVPGEHVNQIQGCLLATGREWCDFVSFNPFFVPEKQIVIIRVKKDLEIQAKIIERINEAWAIIQSELKK